MSIAEEVNFGVIEWMVLNTLDVMDILVEWLKSSVIGKGFTKLSYCSTQVLFTIIKPAATLSGKKKEVQTPPAKIIVYKLYQLLCNVGIGHMGLAKDDWYLSFLHGS